MGAAKKSLNVNGRIKCGKCFVEKYPIDYARDKRSAIGYQTVCKECQRQYRNANKEKIASNRNGNEKYLHKMREYFLEHKDQINAYKRNRYRTKEGKEKVRSCNEKRRALKRDTSDGTVTYKAIITKLREQNYKCAISGVPLDEYHVDHIIPLAKGGKHIIENIQLILPSLNLSKKDKSND